MSGMQLSLLVLGIFGLFHSSLADCGTALWGRKTSYSVKSGNVPMPGGQQDVKIQFVDGNKVCGLGNFVGEEVVSCDQDQIPIIDPLVNPAYARIHRTGRYEGYSYVVYYCNYSVPSESAGYGLSLASLVI